MKKQLTLAVIAATFAIPALAQKIESSKVPGPVIAAFAKQYPAAKPKWEKEKEMYEAGFKSKGQSMSVLYSADGTLKETEVDIKVSALPKPVLSYLAKNKAGMKISEAAKITRADGSVVYEAEVKGKDLLFDEAGNPVK